MKNTARIGFVLACSTAGLAWQIVELCDRAGHEMRIAALVICASLTGAAWSTFYDLWQLRRHLARIRRLYAARRRLPSGSSTLKTEASRHGITR